MLLNKEADTVLSHSPLSKVMLDGERQMVLSAIKYRSR